MKLTAIIIDDEEKGRLSLKEKLKTYLPEVEVLAEAADAEEGARLIQQLEPGIIFLDIQMPRQSGFDMLNKIARHNFHIIFTTAYSQYAIKAIKYAAFDYLLKPVDVEELTATISRLSTQKHPQTHEQLAILQQNLQAPDKLPGKLALPSLDGLHFYKIDDIVFLEADRSYTILHTLNKTGITVSKNLKEIEELLPSNQFFRAHHSYLINLHHIKRYIRGEGGQIEMTTGEYVDLARRKKEEFLQLIGRH